VSPKPSRCKVAYWSAVGSLVASLACLGALFLQFKFRDELGDTGSLFIGSLAGFFGFLILSHMFTGWLAVLNGRSWVTYGFSPILKPIGGVAFSIYELRTISKQHGWL